MWLTRRSWAMLGTIGIGIILAATLMGIVPIATNISISLALQHALQQPYQNTIVLAASAVQSQEVSSITAQLDALASQTLTPYPIAPAEVALRSPDSVLNPQTSIHIKAFPVAYLKQRFSVISGQLPSATAATNDIILTQETASQLHAKVGTSLPLRVENAQRHGASLLVPLRVVGIVAMLATSPDDPFDGEPIQPIVTNNQFTDTALTIAPIFENIVRAVAAVQPSFAGAIQAVWAYQIPPERVTAKNFAQIQTDIQAFDRQLPQIFAQHLATNTVYGTALPTLEDYDQRITTTQLPLTAFALQMLILFGWLITAMIDLLLDHEEQTIAVLRSRGAYAWQFLPRFLIPLLLIAIAAAGAGPWIAAQLILVFLTHLQGIAYSPSLAESINVGQVLADFIGYSFIGIAVMMAVCAFALYRKLQLTIVTVRQHAGRGERAAFWRRYPLDVLLAFVLLGIYLSYTVFIAPSLAPATFAQTAPLAVYTPLCALMAATIVLFRIFPWIAQWGVSLGKAWRGIVPLLANAHLVLTQRAIRQAAISLALAIGLLCFVSSYQLTRIQHNQDYAAFQVGSDVSFALPIDTSSVTTAQQQEQRFEQIAGVDAASAGAILDIYPQVGSSTHIRMLGVDAQTFPAVAAWHDADAQQNMNVLLQGMVQARATAQEYQSIPVIVDDALWQTYHLTNAGHFALDLSGNGTLRLHFQVYAHVAHLPMIADLVNDTSTGIVGGMLVDFPTLAQAIKQADPQANVSPGYMWLKTAHDPPALAHTRQALEQPPYQIAVYQDRLQLLNDMRYDPLSLALADTTTIGAAMTIMLALLLTSQIGWNLIRKRTLNLSALYALGASRRQIAGIIGWEIGVQALFAMFAGILLGILATGIIVPLITFAQSSDTHQAITSLLIPPPRIIIPWQSILLGAGSFLCVIALLLTLGVPRYIRRTLTKTLRLSED